MTFFSYRLDPRYFVVWRTPTSLQIGIDHAIVRFDPVSRAEETMLHALKVGIGFEGLHMLADDAEGDPHAVAQFVEKVKPVLDSARTSPFAGRDIVVEGDSPGAVALRRLLAQLVSRDGSSEQITIEKHPDLAVIVSPWAVRPAVAARWLRRDVAHLPVVFSDQEARIGPLVTPGVGPCVHCVHLAAAERDPAWVAIASQLHGRRAPSEEPLLVTSVTAITARLIRSYLASDGRGLRPGVVVHVNASSGAVTETVRAVHPECACRALPEIATQRESASASPPCPPTTGQAFVSLA